MRKITFPIRLESTNGSIFEIRETSSRNNPVQIWEKKARVVRLPTATGKPISMASPKRPGISRLHYRR